MIDKDKVFVCCICGSPTYGFGNNPWPVVEDENARCCDVCNYMRVIPARLAMMGEKQKDENV